MIWRCSGKISLNLYFCMDFGLLFWVCTIFFLSQFEAFVSFISFISHFYLFDTCDSFSQIVWDVLLTQVGYLFTLYSFEYIIEKNLS